MNVPKVGSVWLSDFERRYIVTGIETDQTQHVYVHFSSEQSLRDFRYSLADFAAIFDKKHNWPLHDEKIDWSEVEQALKAHVAAMHVHDDLRKTSEAAEEAARSAHQILHDHRIVVGDALKAYNTALNKVEGALK